MAASLEAEGGRRGSALLMEHLTERPPARRRLAAHIGEELTRFLLLALAGDHGVRSRRRGWRRGSSSP